MKYLHHSDADFKYKSHHMLAKNEVRISASQGATSTSEGM